MFKIVCAPKCKIFFKRLLGSVFNTRGKFISGWGLRRDGHALRFVPHLLKHTHRRHIFIQLISNASWDCIWCLIWWGVSFNRPRPLDAVLSEWRRRGHFHAPPPLLSSLSRLHRANVLQTHRTVSNESVVLMSCWLTDSYPVDAGRRTRGRGLSCGRGLANPSERRRVMCGDLQETNRREFL